MKNNKGMTLVEIIISIALISIVLLFLFMLLITVNDINDESEVNSSYLINKSLILKNIEEDLSKTEVSSVKLSTCNIADFYTSYNTYKDSLETKYKANQCISIAYLDADNNLIGEKPAYISIYYYQNKSSYVISYIHGNVKATRLLEDYEKYNVNQSTGTLKSDDFKIQYTNADIANNADNSTIYYDDLGTTGTSTTGFQKITIPIIGPDEKDYSIIISYYGKVTIE